MARLEALTAQERECAADVIEHLVELERRELVLDKGFSSLFDYCRQSLGYSEAGAFLRIRAARAARDFPRILSDLRAGALHLDAIARLYPVLTEANSDDLLLRVSGATKREVLAIVAELKPEERPTERDVIRRVPALVEVQSVIPPPERVRLSFTADDEFLVMLSRLKSLMRHKFPKGKLEDVLKAAIAKLLRTLEPKVNPSRKPSTPRKRSRRIPACVKAEVRARDAGQCAYVAPDGRRCESRDFLEFDHVIPWAVGGRSDTAENIRLLCRPHNQRLARKRFGPRRRAA